MLTRAGGLQGGCRRWWWGVQWCGSSSVLILQKIAQSTLLSFSKPVAVVIEENEACVDTNSNDEMWVLWSK